tara:strand:+ start:1444 stop:2130 length:687 start_codon:yes stop_codon:yes gene_type:complete
MITNTVYSHSTYFDVLEIFLERWDLFYGAEINIFADKKYKDYNTIIYDDKLNYTDRLIQCLENTNCDIFLYQHEDMFLYDEPDSKKLKDYEKILMDTDNSFIRLTKAGACKFSKSDLNETLLNISKDSENFFAVQSTLWKKADLIKFLKEAGSLSIWDLEWTSPTINIKASLSGLSHFDNEPPRGGHFDSNMWPYVATAINKGKWNFGEYKKEFSEIDKVLSNKRPRY